ncbi:MAG: Kelch repeat-containing protein [Xanthobacteraceae bacterium]
MTVSVRSLSVIASVALLGALASALAQAPVGNPTAANPWVTLAPFPEPSEELLGATANGKLYIFCGLAPGWKPKALVYEYDPATNKWTQRKPMALPSHHVAFATLNDKIYAFGGFKYPDAGPPAWQPIDNTWEYDPVADSWKSLAPMPGKRGAATAAVANGKIYVTGGATTLAGVSENGLHPSRPHQVLATVEEYDPATNSWRERRSMLVPRNHHAVASVNDKVYAVGGRISGAFIGISDVIDLLEIYDPATDLWTRGEKMPTPRSAITAAVWNSKIFVPGGEAQDRRALAAFRAVEMYDPAVNRWQIMPSMPHPRHGLGVGVIGDRLYAVSGDGQSAGSGIAESDVGFNEALQLNLVAK